MLWLLRVFYIELYLSSTSSLLSYNVAPICSVLLNVSNRLCSSQLGP